MPLTQAQQANGNGSQADWRLLGRQGQGGGMGTPFGGGQGNLGWVTPIAGNPYGVVGSPNLFSQFASAAGYGAGADKAAGVYSGFNPGGFTNGADANAAAGFTEDDVARLFGQQFGNVTPQARVAGGLPATGPVVTGPAGAVDEGTRFANGGGANNAPVAPKSTPQQAGDNNSMMPGWSTGNTEVGTPASPVGATPNVPMPGRSATDPLNVALGNVPAPTQEPNAAPPAGGLGDVTPKSVAATAFPQGSQDASAALPVSPAKAAATDTAPGTPVVDDSSGTKPIAPPALTEWNGISGAWHEPKGAKPPTTFDSAKPVGANAPIGTVVGALSDTYLRALAIEIGNRVEGAGGGKSLAALINGGAAGLPHFAGWLATTEKMVDLLNASAPGLGWDPVSAALGRPSKYGAQPGGTTPPGTTPPGTTPPGDTGTTSAGGTVSNSTMGNISDYGSRSEAFMRNMGLKGWNDPKMQPFLSQFKMALMQMFKAQDDQQGALNIYGGAINDFKNDPLRAQQVKMMGDIMAHPDNTPWDAIRDQAITGSHQTAEDVNAQYARSAQRRLGSAGAAASPGLFADISRKQSGDLNDQLGQLRIQQAEGERNAQYKALGAADSIRASTTGADAQMAQTLANIRRAVAEGGTNPLQDAGSALINSTSFNQLLNSQNSSYGDIGDFFMSFLGGGNFSGTQMGALGGGINQQGQNFVSGMQSSGKAGI